MAGDDHNYTLDIDMRICTVTVTAQLNQVFTLAHSLRECHHPDTPVTVLLVDQLDTPEPNLIKGVELMGVGDIGVDQAEFIELASMYAPTDLSLGLRARLFEFLLDRSEGDAALLYLEPECYVIGPLTEIKDALTVSELVLIDHLSKELPDDDYLPDEGQLIGIGRVSTHVMALRDGATTRSLLREWWQTYERGEMPDREMWINPLSEWLQQRVETLSDVEVVRLPNYSVGYWNLYDRSLELRDGVYEVDGLPLKIPVFMGYSLDKEEQLSSLQNRIDAVDSPDLGSLLSRYASDLGTQGEYAMRTPNFRYEMLPDTQIISHNLRRLYRQARCRERVECEMVTEEGTKKFFAWLAQPVAEAGSGGVNRFLWQVYQDSDDLQQAYSNLDDETDLEGFLGWVYIHGGDGVPVPKQLMPPKPEGVDKLELRAFTPEAPKIEGVNVAGFFSSELGLGEAARLLIGGLEAASVPIMPIRGANVPGVRQGVDYQFLTPKDAIYPVNILCINGDGIPGFAVEAGREFFRDRYTIALWWWEVGDVLPPFWFESFDYLDEIWVGTDFVGEAISAHAPIPVTKITLPIGSDTGKILPTRASLGLPENYVFLYMYDYFSCGARKNPQGLVQAFKRAFPEPSEKVSLVLKCLNSRGMSAEHARLLGEIDGRPDIQIIDTYLDADVKDALIASCDCYVSLHRSEGLGLSLAEAVYLGKPLIATAYGGVHEFISSEDGYLVDYEEAKIGYAGYPYYPSTGHWVDPDIDQAAELIRHVFEHQEEADERAKRAAKKLRQTHSAQRAGESMRSRLETIVRENALISSLAGSTDEPPLERPDLAGELTSLEREIDLLARPRYSRHWPLRVAKKALGRLLRPYTRQQVETSKALAEVARSTAAAIDDLRGGLERTARDISLATAGSMRSSRRANTQLTSLRSRVAGIEDSYQHHRDLDRVLPYMADSTRPQLFHHPVAGRVFGYRAELAKTNGSEDYALFEDAFRGDYERIVDLQKSYVELLAGHTPVLDVGCGRGELLDILAEADIDATGIDPDAGMVERCRQKGHDVTLADANTYLAGLDSNSLGAITACQVVEHMPYDYLREFIRLAFEKLRPSGLLVLETVNPHCHVALKAFWLDPTHQHPIFPEVLLVLGRIAGFGEVFAYHPTGIGDAERDMFEQPAYAVVGSKGSAG